MIDVEIEDDGWSVALAGAASLAQAAARAALGTGQPDGAGGVVILLTDDETVRDLNARFRGKDQPTNVLSFPAPAEGAFGGDGPRPLGDVALALGVCQREAAAQGKPLADHLQHLTAHGVLHLLGHDHETDADAQVMEALERRILAGLGVPDPYEADGVSAQHG
jgi:probable rRNA maturation factor